MYAQFTSLFMAILLQCLGQYYCDGKGSTTAMNKQHACLGYHFRIFVGNSAIFFSDSVVCSVVDSVLWHAVYLKKCFKDNRRTL